jgi:putative ABC transport system permease protein
VDTLRTDLRVALRLLTRERAFAATAILMLALCIGANTAIFTVVRSVLFRPLPYPQPDRLVFLYDGFPGAGVERAGTSVPNYYDRVDLADVFSAVALYRDRGVDVGQAGSVERVQAMEVTPSFFKVLGVSLPVGRPFTEQEGQPGGGKVVILAEGYARRLFGSLDRIPGRDLRIGGEPYTVVGVMPAGFTFLDPDVKAWLPAGFTAEQRSEDARYSQNHDSIARLAPGVTIAQAQARLDRLTERNLEKAGPLKHILVNAGYTTHILLLRDDLVRDVRRTLNLLWGGVLFILLIAAVNLANLVLVRATGRVKELAMRHVLGADRARLARQLLTETTLVTVIGGALGLLLGAWTLRWLSSIGFAELPRGHEIRLDWVVVAVTFAVAVLLGLVVGAVPAAQVARLDLKTLIHEDGRTGTAGRGTRTLRRVLVAAQVALACVLLVGAGLLLASFRHLLRVDPGFRPDHVLTARVNPPASRYADDPELVAYAGRALEAVRALPGVTAAGISDSLPFGDDFSSSVVFAEGYEMSPGESVISPNQVRVTPGYFEAMGVPLVAGRFFTDSDTKDTARVVIVDEKLAKKFWPKGDAVGRRMYQPNSPEEVGHPTEKSRWMRVVGVVGTVKMYGLAGVEESRVGAYYFPYAQNATRGIGFALKTEGDPAKATAAVREALRGIDPELPMFDVLSMSQRLDKSLDDRRTPMLLSLAFGAVALLLASVGLYGVLAYQVGQRTREIGLRMALGGRPADILALVLREGAMVVGVGLVTGLAGAVALRGVIASQLYGIGALDPRVVGGVVGVLAAAALLASMGPARRAARVDPVVALSEG